MTGWGASSAKRVPTEAAGAQPSGGAEPEPSWDLLGRLEQTWAVLERILSSMPPTRLELKRTIERELGFTPRAELLQAMVRVSEAQVHDHRVVNLVRGMLAVHVTAESEIHEFRRARLGDVETIHRTTGLLTQLRQAFQRLMADAADTMERTDPSSRSHLERLRKWLAIAEERFLASSVLGPHVCLLAEAAAAGRLDAMGLRDDEIALVEAAYRGSCGDRDNRSRGAVDGIAFRLRMEEDLAAWRELPPADEEDDTATEERFELFERLRRDRVAYQDVSDRLQGLRDAHFRSGRVHDAEVLRVTLKDLFAFYLTVSRVLGAGAMAPPEQAEMSAEDDAALAEELRLAEEAGARVEAQQQARREVVRRAVAGADSAPAKPKRSTPTMDPRKLRRRRNVLLGTAAALAVAAVGINAALWRPGGSSPELSPEQLKPAMFVSEAIQVGQLLCSSTSRRVWDSMNEPERVKKVQDLAHLARQRGIREIILEDEQHHELAYWSVAKGVELAD